MSALFAYISEFSLFDLTGSVNFRFESSEKFMVLDDQTVQALELVRSKDDESKTSLLHVLDKTVTPMGRRQLRNLILQPFRSTVQFDYKFVIALDVDNDEIVARQQASNVLARSTEAFQDIRKLLKELPDIDTFISGVLYSPLFQYSPLDYTKS